MENNPKYDLVNPSAWFLYGYALRAYERGLRYYRGLPQW